LTWIDWNQRVTRLLSFRDDQGQLKPIDRAVKAHKRCYKAAKGLSSKYDRALDDENGPVKSALFSFRPKAGKQEGMVLGLETGCFMELPAGFSGVFCGHRAQSCSTLRGSLRCHVVQGGPWHVPLEDPPRVGSSGHFCPGRPHLGPELQARRPAVARRLHQARGWQLRS